MGKRTLARRAPAFAIGWRIRELQVTNDSIIADLTDGRTISVPLAWSWRLSDATPEQRAHYEIIGSGQGIHWPDVDEDISAQGMLCGIPAHRPKAAERSQQVLEIDETHTVTAR